MALSLPSPETQSPHQKGLIMNQVLESDDRKTVPSEGEVLPIKQLIDAERHGRSRSVKPCAATNSDRSQQNGPTEVPEVVSDSLLRGQDSPQASGSSHWGVSLGRVLRKMGVLAMALTLVASLASAVSDEGDGAAQAVAEVIDGAMDRVGLGDEEASAVTVRSGWRWYQTDILLSWSETRSVASGLTGGMAICWPVIGLGAGAGAVVGAWAATLVCLSAVTVCAAKAAVKGRSAGFTISPTWRGGARYWCWDY